MAKNWALQSNGSTATASSIYAASHAASFAIDGKRTPGSNWTTGGIWHSADIATVTAPQWLQIDFAAAKTITEFVVSTARDVSSNISAVDSLIETANSYGIKDFFIETKASGGGWTERKRITGNTKLMLRIPIAPVSCVAVRISITNSASGQARIAEFEAWDAPSPAGKFSQILFFGNSITIHPYKSSVAWYSSTYGMAASEPSLDYVHQLITRMKADYGFSPTYQAFYNALWEQTYSSFDKSTYNYQFNPKPDLVVVAVGDNVSTYTANYDIEYGNLLDYIINLSPNAQVICLGSYYNRPEVDVAQAAAAAAHGLLFIPQAQLYTLANQAGLGTMTVGDDGVFRAITDNDVATHPGDIGHRNRANTIYDGMYKSTANTSTSSFTPTGGRNVGDSTTTSGIYLADSGFSSSNTTTAPANYQNYNFGTIANPPPVGIMPKVRFVGGGSSFTETFNGLTPSTSYHFRTFTVWDNGSFDFSVKANSNSVGTVNVPANTAGIVRVCEFDVTSDSSGTVILEFITINNLALVNAIDFGLATPAPTDNTPPVITGFNVSSTQSKVLLDFTATDNTGVAGFDLDYSLSGDVGSYISLISGGNVTNFSHNNTQPNTLYFYRLRAIDSNSNKSTYSTLTIRTPLPLPPNAPTDGVNIGDDTTTGIFTPEIVGQVGGGTSSRVNNARTYTFGTIAYPPSQAAMVGVRYATVGFTYLQKGLNPSTLYKFRVFSGWDGTAYRFNIKANNTSFGDIIQTGGNGNVEMKEFTVSSNSAGEVLFEFTSIQTFALINAIDWRLYRDEFNASSSITNKIQLLAGSIVSSAPNYVVNVSVIAPKQSISANIVRKLEGGPVAVFGSVISVSITNSEVVDVIYKNAAVIDIISR